MHLMFHELLKTLYLTESIKGCVLKMANERIDEYCKSDAFIIQNNKRELTQIDRKLDKLEECLLNDELAMPVYRKWDQKLQEQKIVLFREIDSLLNRSSFMHQRFHEMFSDLSNLDNIFVGCNFIGGQQLIKKIFETGLTYDGQTFSTSYLHPVFSYLLELSDKNFVQIGNRNLINVIKPITINEKDINEERKTIAETELADTIAHLMIESLMDITT